MELSKYDSLICKEHSIQHALQRGQHMKAKMLKMRYNWALKGLRKHDPTDIPLYSIRDFTNICGRSWLIDYEPECGFCGSTEGIETLHMSTGNVRTIRICSSELCKDRSRRYILFKKGWIKPEIRQYSLFKAISAPIVTLIINIYSHLF